MQLLHRYPHVVTRSILAARRDAGHFVDCVDDYGIPGGAGRYCVTVNTVLVDGLRLVAIRTTGHTVRLVENANLVLIVAHRGLLVTDDGRGAMEVHGDRAALPRPGARTTHMPGPYTGLGLHVPLARLAAHAALNPHDPWDPDRHWPSLPGPRLVRALRYVVGELDAPDPVDPASGAARGLSRLLLDLLVDEFAASAGGQTRPVSAAGLAQVRRVEAALRERFRDDVSILALAGEFGISTRALQAGFRRHRGTTPRDFLAACRLEAARERLSRARAGETVASVAHECGLPHLGRFAANYRARYGEAPSTTLARRWGRS